MREESHLDDMRAAIRGDFERLAQRRGGQELMQEAELRAEEPAEAEPSVEPEAESPLELAAEEPHAAPEVAEEPPPPKGFLARLFGRSL